MAQIKGQARDIKRNNLNLIPGKRGWFLWLLISQIIKHISKRKINVFCPFFKCRGIGGTMWVVIRLSITWRIPAWVLLQCHPQRADAAHYSPRGRNHKYLVWLQSKVLSVSRLFFSSPGENISDSASIKLHNAGIEGDCLLSLHLWQKISL